MLDVAAAPAPELTVIFPFSEDLTALEVSGKTFTFTQGSRKNKQGKVTSLGYKAVFNLPEWLTPPESLSNDEKIIYEDGAEEALKILCRNYIKDNTSTIRFGVTEMPNFTLSDYVEYKSTIGQKLLTKERITEALKLELPEVITLLLVEGGREVTEDTINQFMEAYTAALIKLASPTAKFDQNTKESLLKALELIDDPSSVISAMLARLNKKEEEVKLSSLL